MLVVDSIIAPFRQEYLGRGELAERQQRLGSIVVQLKKMAEEFNLCVVLTNQVSADPGSSAMFVANAKKAVGGHCLSHNVDTIISLSKGKGEQRVAKVVDSPSMPEADAVFQLSNGGVCDPSD